MKKSKKCKVNTCCVNTKSQCSGVYGLGFIGSATYYISTATSF